MKKTVLIIGMAIALISIIYSFFAMGDKGELFGLEMNIWVYRLIWLVLFSIILNGYVKELKKGVIVQKKDSKKYKNVFK